MIPHRFPAVDEVPTSKENAEPGENEPLLFVRKDTESLSIDEHPPLTEEEKVVGLHADMEKEIQQNKCLPDIRTEADFEAASQRGYHSATNHLTKIEGNFPNWSIDDLTKIHLLYFADLYPHAGELRKRGDLATFNGRVGADSNHIPEELNLLLSQAQELYKKLPSADTAEGLTERLSLIAFVHARLVLIHPFRDGNGRWTRLIVSSLERQLLPATDSRAAIPRQVYIEALKALPSNMGPLLYYHANKRGLQPSTLRPIKPPFPIQVTRRGQ